MNRKIASIILGSCLLAACASETPRPMSTESRMDRQKFISATEDRLDTWDKKAEDLKGAKQSELRATIQDTRAELRSLEAAGDTSWVQHRNRVESNLAQMNSRFGRAE
jgi:hypothetical protein